jgi:uncharacterized protein (TIGR03086 family)
MNTEPTPHLDDPRMLFARAVTTAGRTIGAVRADQLDGPTPCDDYDVRAMLGHLVAVLGRVAVMGEQGDPFTVPQVVVGVADDAWLAAWQDAAHHVQAAWSDDAALEREVTLPWAQLPGRGILAMYTNEVSVHTWDLATATGQQPAWDPVALDVALVAVRRALPAGDREQEFAHLRASLPPHVAAGGPPFRNAVPVADDAPVIDRLVAYNGRQP